MGSDPDAPTRRPLAPAPFALAAALLVGLAATGCDDAVLQPPEPEAGPIFERYVALGNSITAGFQSSGISDSTQSRSYAVMLAAGMDTRFEIPALRSPGCPPPLTNVFTGERVGGGAATDCALRRTPVPPFLSNVAVPGAEVLDALTNLGPETNATALTTLLLGGRTQLAAAAEVRPTFASVWLGNNDVLGAALAGNPSLITPPATFAERYETLLNSLEEVAARSGLEGLLVGVADVTLAPHLSPGAAYWQAEQQGALPPTFDVADSCAPAAAGGQGEQTLVPFGYGFGELFARASAGEPVTLDCLLDPPVLTADEIQQFQVAVASYNATIQAEAEERGWAYFDPNPLLAARKAAGEIPLFPNVPPDPAAESAPFGPLFSKDGVHPSTAAHRILADAMADAIDEHYGTDVAVPEIEEAVGSSG